jgi:6-methylsalicylate decarboxylase
MIRLLPGGSLQVDVHQHLWPAQLIEALRRRARPPRLRGWTLELDGQTDDALDPAAHDPAARAEQALRDGLDLALVSLSSPLGIEFLPPEEADELLDAYHEGVLTLPHPFRGWAAARLTEPDGAELERELERGFVGLQLPATALLDAEGYRTAAPLLDVLDDSQRPLMIHPGAAVSSPQAPPWWPAVVGYVQQMHAAWFAFREYGRPKHPELRVCFAVLAGLAPLHGERFASRTGLRSVIDGRAFLEISSYGTRAIDATVRVLGIDVLVNGSDRPYGEPMSPDLGAAAVAAMRSSNPARLLDRKEATHGRLAVASGAQS